MISCHVKLTVCLQPIKIEMPYMRIVKFSVDFVFLHLINDALLGVVRSNDPNFYYKCQNSMSKSHQDLKIQVTVDLPSKRDFSAHLVV